MTILMNRCPWSLKTDIEQGYHDREWDVPQFEDQVLFEFIILESTQARLSWRTRPLGEPDMAWGFLGKSERETAAYMRYVRCEASF